MSVRDEAKPAVSRASGCFSRFLLERYLAAELGDPDASRVASHLEACARCQGLLETLEKEKAAFQDRVPFDRFYSDLEARLRRDATADRDARQATLEMSGGRVGSWLERVRAWIADFSQWLAGPRWAVVAVVAVALVVVLPRTGGLIPGDHDDGSRIKATAVHPGPLEVVLLRDGRIVQAVSGDLFHQGDRLQFRIAPGTWRFLHLVSLDDQGRLTPFYPDDGSASLELRLDAEQLLPGAIELDDFVGQERIFAVFSQEPLDYSVVEEAARRLGAGMSLPLDLARIEELPIDGTAQVSFLMIKE